MNRAAFFDALRRDKRVFGKTLSQGQVDGCNIVVDTAQGLPVSHAAYLLATAYHETAETMQPVRETLATTDASAIRILDNAWQAGKLSWVKTPYWRPDADGKSWLGRGYVQLTWKDNYKKASALVGADLVANPAKAMQPDIAAKVLVQGCSQGTFTGKKLADFLPGDYVAARRVVNGNDRAAKIAQYADAFEAALVAAGYGAAQPVGFWATIIKAVLGIFGKGKA